MVCGDAPDSGCERKTAEEEPGLWSQDLAGRLLLDGMHGKDLRLSPSNLKLLGDQ